jgi:hypothetical protein
MSKYSLIFIDTAGSTEAYTPGSIKSDEHPEYAFPQFTIHYIEEGPTIN